MGVLGRSVFLLVALTVVTGDDSKPAALVRDREELSEQDDMTMGDKQLSMTPLRMYDYNNYDSLTARYGPNEPPSHSDLNKYVLPEARLAEMREQFMYWYFDKGGPNDEGDLQRDIHHSNPQIHKNFNFQLPFYGSRFNYTRISLNGYLEFSDPPDHYTYPLSFPVKDWPKAKDPAFIGIFFSKCRIGHLRPDDVDQRAAGVYFRLERDLMTRTDVFGVEVRERLMWDIREGVVGSDTFIPKHAAIITWKNVSFAGGIDNSLYVTNTFQVVLATDEVYTYAIFNYLDLQWTTHTEAGGDTTRGEGGVPAFVGFNAGNGTGSVEYKPYSQASVLRDLSGRGWANGFPGRHIFRLDEKIMLGTCNKDVAGTNLPLVFAPESGNMLGGTVVNITGPCFEPGMRVRCRFDTEEVIGTVVNKNRALCVQPYLMAEGYIRFEVSVGDNAFLWKGKYFVETPATAIERIHFQTNDVHTKNPKQIEITWEKANLTTNFNAPLSVSIWGYKESTIRPQLMYIDSLESTTNTGSYVIHPEQYRLRNNRRELLDLQYGFIQINLTNSDTYSGLTITPVLWSRPIPLAWYFNAQWERLYETAKWPDLLCDQWLKYDRYLKDFANELPVCPCTLEHALADLGRFMPDPTCDKDINPECYFHKGAIHCVRSGAPRLEGSEQQCCYDRDGFLMLSYDQQWGSRPRRAHNLGFLPWNEANKVPTLSQWYHDVIPYYMCCLWQDEQAVGCETLRFERRPSQDCVAYQSPAIATVFGDPHFITFDNVEYTFNGKGEFVLVQANRANELLNIQGRFEQVPDNIYGEVRATQLTAIAAQDNSSAIIEVKIRPPHAQWRYRLDVLADGRRIYFDRPALKMQHFSGVTVFTPSYVIDQSEVIIMFPSGAGVEVNEKKGFMTARVYLPWTFVNKTKGLFGNWSFDVTDEFVNPDGSLAGVSLNTNNFQTIHQSFGINWLLEEGDESLKGQSLFTREFNRLGSYYTNKTFVPEYRRDPAEFIPSNRSYDVLRASDICGQSYQCKYDYAMTLNHDLAKQTLSFREKYVALRTTNQKVIKTCGVLETPRFGRKSTFRFTPGTKVQFECNQDFTPYGDKRRTCLADGHWDVPEYGYIECLRQQEYELQTGWKAVGAIAAVMIPLAVIILCIYCCDRKRKGKEVLPRRLTKKLKATSLTDKFNYISGRFTPPEKQGLGANLRAKDSPDRSRKPFGKAYKTNEPLPPPIDFSGRDADLSDVDDKDEKLLWKRVNANLDSDRQSLISSSSSSSEEVKNKSVKHIYETSDDSEHESSSTKENQRKSSKAPSSVKSGKLSNRSSLKSLPSRSTSQDLIDLKEPLLLHPRQPSLTSHSDKSGRRSSATDSFQSADSSPSIPSSPIPDYANPDRFYNTTSDRDSSSPSVRPSLRPALKPPRPPPPPAPVRSTSINASGRSTSSESTSDAPSIPGSTHPLTSSSSDLSKKSNLSKGMQEYSSKWSGLTWGIALLIIVPIAVVLVFIGYKYMKKNDVAMPSLPTMPSFKLRKKDGSSRSKRATAMASDPDELDKFDVKQK